MIRRDKTKADHLAAMEAILIVALILIAGVTIVFAAIVGYIMIDNTVLGALKGVGILLGIYGVIYGLYLLVMGLLK